MTTALFLWLAVAIVIQYLLLRLVMLMGATHPPSKLALWTMAFLPVALVAFALWIHFDPSSCPPDDADMCPISFAAKMISILWAGCLSFAGAIAVIFERWRTGE